MRKLIPLTALVLGTTAARADNGLFYLGAGFARNSVSDTIDRGVRARPQAHFVEGVWRGAPA
jgi:hypothetical protein